MIAKWTSAASDRPLAVETLAPIFCINQGNAVTLWLISALAQAAERHPDLFLIHIPLFHRTNMEFSSPYTLTPRPSRADSMPRDGDVRAVGSRDQKRGFAKLHALARDFFCVVVVSQPQ